MSIEILKPMQQTMKAFEEIPVGSKIIRDYPGLKAVLFDLDGTIVNSERIHLQALITALKLDLKVDEAFFDKYSGINDEKIIQALKPKANIDEFLEKKQLLVKERSDLLDKIIHPQIITFLQELKAQGLRLAIVTSSDPSFTELIISRFSLNVFETITTVADVKRPKPHPEPYLITMKKLGVLPHECLVFEDSIPGITSARNSGVHVGKVLWF